MRAEIRWRSLTRAIPHPASPGEPQQLRVRFLRAEGYPVDLYYLMDLSYSMKDDLERVRQLGQDLLARLQEVTHSVRIGELGLYLQKPLLPLPASWAHRGPACPLPVFNRPGQAPGFWRLSPRTSTF